MEYKKTPSPRSWSLYLYRSHSHCYYCHTFAKRSRYPHISHRLTLHLFRHPSSRKAKARPPPPPPPKTRQRLETIPFTLQILYNKHSMKPNIHPQWYPEAQVICACGKTFTIGSTKETVHVEICYHCHPFFTGEMKYIDTLGRVERYQEKQKVAKSKVAQLAAKKKKKEETQIKEERSPKTLKEMLLGIQ